jgi:DNA (cytosine-5)-methyltransferase 1
MIAPPPPLSAALLEHWKKRKLRQSRQFGDSQRMICPAPDQPSPAILTSADMFAHPTEPRRFTIDEGKLMCGFPADFVLKGTYAEQWARLGNAVPPLMMREIACTLRDGLFRRLGRTKMQQQTTEALAATQKPPFRIPSMSEVAAARGTAGLTVASTFSGCGGSCLGFEMAGYRVVWANEFLPIARESYAANHPETILDGRDICEVEPEEILAAAGLEPGELDVFNGSPPCQAFSTAGQQHKGWGKEREYSNGVKQRNEELFFEYIRLLRGLRPRAFVAENVAGLTRGVALGYFKQIMRELDASGYEVRCRVLDAQWLGVPQTRSRAIFIGIRKDLGIEPEFPKPRSYRYTLREVLPSLMGVGHRSQGGWYDRSPFHMRRRSADEPVPCITSTAPSDYSVIDQRAIHDPGGQFTAGDVTDQPFPCAMIGNSHHYKIVENSAFLPKGSVARKSWEALHPGQKGVKLRGRLLRTHPDKPSPCILSEQGQGGASTAAVTMPNEPRRFTIEELRIVCGFPADFELKGTYSEQWARLGNAVPPLMMREVATALRDGPFERLGRTHAGFIEAR